MRLWATGLAVALSTALTAAGCGGATRTPASTPRSETGTEVGAWPVGTAAFAGVGVDEWWAPATGADLVPTGVQLKARAPFTDVVVDGSGAAWLHGGWRLVRVDPATGTAREWDLGDDRAFAEVSALRPADGAGVWLVSPDRLRQFDGERFVSELEVPPEVRGGPDGQISDLVEIGSRVWVSSSAGVFRLADANWTRLSPPGLTAVASLTSDGSGGVWAHGSAVESSLSDTVVGGIDAAGRWDPAPGSPRRVDEVLSLPGGGVLVRGGVDLSAFDGTTWTRLPRLGVDIGGPSARAAAVTSDGVVWVRGETGLARITPGGDWQLVRGGTQPPAQAIVASGEHVLALTGSSLVRYDGDGRLEPIWEDEAPAMVATPAGVADWMYWPDARPSAGDPLPPRHVVALSATHAWVAPQLYPRPFRLEEGRWRELPVAPLSADAALTRASDGAVWALTVEGLVRFPQGEPPQALSRVGGSQLVAGAEGSVWVVPDMWYGWWYLSAPNTEGQVTLPQLVNVRADGDRTLVPLPVAEWTITSVVAGVDGSIWVTHCPEGGEDPCPSGTELMRWKDGQWRSVAHAGHDVAALAVAGDGALWARLLATPGANPELARYHDGAWTRWSDIGGLSSSALAPDGSLCTITAQAELACVDRDGKVRRSQVPVVGRLSIGLDGSVWVVGDGGVAILPLLPGR